MFALMETTGQKPVHLVPDDDAMDARWWTMQELAAAETKDGVLTDNCVRVICRAEALYLAGLLPTAPSPAAEGAK